MPKVPFKKDRSYRLLHILVFRDHFQKKTSSPCLPTIGITAFIGSLSCLRPILSNLNSPLQQSDHFLGMALNIAHAKLLSWGCPCKSIRHKFSHLVYIEYSLIENQCVYKYLFLRFFVVFLYFKQEHIRDDNQVNNAHQYLPASKSYILY